LSLCLELLYKNSEKTSQDLRRFKEATVTVKLGVPGKGTRPVIHPTTMCTR
jgi:hypothetical protein